MIFSPMTVRKYILIWSHCCVAMSISRLVCPALRRYKGACLTNVFSEKQILQYFNFSLKNALKSRIGPRATAIEHK